MQPACRGECAPVLYCAFTGNRQGDSRVTFALKRADSNGVYYWHEHRKYKLDVGSRFSFPQWPICLQNTARLFIRTGCLRDGCLHLFLASRFTRSRDVHDTKI